MHQYGLHLTQYVLQLLFQRGEAHTCQPFRKPPRLSKQRSTTPDGTASCHSTRWTKCRTRLSKWSCSKPADQGIDQTCHSCDGPRGKDTIPQKRSALVLLGRGSTTHRMVARYTVARNDTEDLLGIPERLLVIRIEERGVTRVETCCNRPSIRFGPDATPHDGELGRLFAAV